VDELDDETDGAHDEETDADCLGDFHELALVWLRDGLVEARIRGGMDCSRTGNLER
jgi:hypothetical protein